MYNATSLVDSQSALFIPREQQYKHGIGDLNFDETVWDST